VSELVQDEFGELRVRATKLSATRPAASPQPKASDAGDASLPDGWETLSVYARRELMRGATAVPFAGRDGSVLVGARCTDPDALTADDERELFAALRGVS
jgi:hypothetical protein